MSGVDIEDIHNPDDDGDDDHHHDRNHHKTLRTFTTLMIMIMIEDIVDIHNPDDHDHVNCHHHVNINICNDINILHSHLLNSE